MIGATILRLVLFLGLFHKCSTVYCHFCKTPTLHEPEKCQFFAQCPRDSPGCVVIEVEDPTKRFLVRTCSLPEKCNETVVTKRNTDRVRMISCTFCDRDLCNSDSAPSYLQSTLFLAVLLRFVI